MPQVSAGILLYRRITSTPNPPSSETGRSEEGGFQVFLAHPGGPFWATKDLGAWTIPKGVVEDGEDIFEGAKREFEEETGITLRGPFPELGAITQKNGKVVHAWACEGDADPALVKSNTTTMKWAGRTVTVPEIDRCEWFDPETASTKINPAQVELILRLAKTIEALESPEKE